MILVKIRLPKGIEAQKDCYFWLTKNLKEDDYFWPREHFHEPVVGFVNTTDAILFKIRFGL